MCVCVCMRTCVCMRECACVYGSILCVCMTGCVKNYVCAPLCLGTPTLLRCRGVQDQQIVEDEEKADLGGLSGDS